MVICANFGDASLEPLAGEETPRRLIPERKFLRRAHGPRCARAPSGNFWRELTALDALGRLPEISGDSREGHSDDPAEGAGCPEVAPAAVQGPCPHTPTSPAGSHLVLTGIHFRQDQATLHTYRGSTTTRSLTSTYVPGSQWTLR
jgi:hypothetical protein